MLLAIVYHAPLVITILHYEQLLVAFQIGGFHTPCLFTTVDALPSPGSTFITIDHCETDTSSIWKRSAAPFLQNLSSDSSLFTIVQQASLWLTIPLESSVIMLQPSPSIISHDTRVEIFPWRIPQPPSHQGSLEDVATGSSSEAETNESAMDKCGALGKESLATWSHVHLIIGSFTMVSLGFTVLRATIGPSTPSKYGVDNRHYGQWSNMSGWLLRTVDISGQERWIMGAWSRVVMVYND